MNRMALFCSLLVVGLTAAALLEHRRDPAPSSVGEQPAAAGTTPVARVTAPPRDVASAPSIDTAAVAARIERELVTPLQERWAKRASFSRVRLPAAMLHLEMPSTEEERAPREDARAFVHFRLEQEGGRFNRSGKRFLFAHGRVAVATGDVELALVRKGTEDVTPRAWQPSDAVLRRFGVDPTKGSDR